MNDFKRLNELNKELKSKLNSLYKDYDNELVKRGLEIAKFQGSQSEKTAILRRIVDLKVDPLINELKKLGRNEEEILEIREKMYDYTREIHENLHTELIKKIKEEQILDEFYLELINGVHNVGVVINDMQKSWQAHIVDGINKEFETKFKDMNKARDFISQNGLFQLDTNGEVCDRTYGAVVKNGEKFEFKPYAVVFESDIRMLESKFDEMIAVLKKIATNEEQSAYINYFIKLKEAFCQRENSKVISAWQEAEIAWMDVRSPIQVGHPLEYYEDAYTHAVALEWDIRLAEVSEFNEDKFKQDIKDSFEKIYKQVVANSLKMHELVLSNINKTQLYISNPMIYYGAELNGLFSAQVVPNDEFVSKKCGKKIFAFVNHVYESAKARPFMRLSGEIFDRDFLNFGREILFTKPEVWRRVYEISTIGHEFGHVLFVSEDSEKEMNTGGVFKFIEEYKATTGGLVNFFLHEEEMYKLPVFHELIARCVGLIAWREVDEVRAYYCEGLIHLSLLFKAGVLGFKDEKLSVNFSLQSYEKFKEICMKNYEDLATHYVKKAEAGEFLAKFCEPDGQSYLPKDENVREFVKFYFDLYQKIGNEIDNSGEWERWQERANEIYKKECV
ncbi:invasion protein CiaB [Campylobacter sp. RM15925]|uniref:invasion protein CiaB n=1 Tax=Campylobacter sp. RM15925 TaxID=1705724 RepID=UPI001475125D|nr:invasion protein CiaB [Campylobacter sp. RM15925]